jgi:hypothetical protein
LTEKETLESKVENFYLKGGKKYAYQSKKNER